MLSVNGEVIFTATDANRWFFQGVLAAESKDMFGQVHRNPHPPGAIAHAWWDLGYEYKTWCDRALRAERFVARLADDDQAEADDWLWQ